MNKLQLLLAIEHNSKITQRDLANQLGYSLGKVNIGIKQLLEEQLISYEKRRYYLTQLGRQYLEQHIVNKSFDKLMLSDFGKIKKAVILNDSKVAVDSVIVTTTIHFFVKKQIDNLLNLGVETIYIVVGYEKDQLKEYLKAYDSSVIFIENDKFLWSGSLHSLALCEPYINEDFLLIEGNVLIDNVSLYNFYHDTKTAILCTNPFSQESLRYVKWDEHQNIVDISANRDELTHIDGVMVGINKINKEIFYKMMSFYETSTNSSLDYAYALKKVAEWVSIKVNFDNYAIVHTIEDEQSVATIEKSIVKKIYKRETAITQLTNTFEDIFQDEKILMVSDAGGLTNNNYIVKTDKEEYIMRLPGAGANQLVSRVNESNNIVAIKDLEINVPTYYFDEHSGVKITKRIQNCVTLTSEMAQYEHYIRKMVNIFHRLHRSNIVLHNEFNFITEYQKYEQLVLENAGNFFENYTVIKDTVIKLYHQLKENLQFKLVPCHNDTLCDNFIVDQKGKMYLIDWEYSGMNDLFWDLAAVMLENNYSQASEELLLYCYFDGQVNDIYRQKILIFKILQDFLWSIWSNYKIALGEDFVDYGLMRYNRCFSLIEEYKEKYE